MSKIAGMTVALSLALAACVTTAPPRLTAVGEPIPAGVNFAGQWQLQREATELAQRSGTGLQDVLAPARGDRNRGRPVSRGPSVYVFLRTGNRLKISQTPHGLFVSFDRSVVEEYRFHEHRVVSVGPIEADRVSGWVEDRYVIRTLDSDGALLEETYSLGADGDVLARTVTIVHENKEVFSLQQQYDRLD
jgi:hypothetical protein